jgi:DNA-binding MarR family transcriptional regulator
VLEKSQGKRTLRPRKLRGKAAAPAAQAGATPAAGRNDPVVVDLGPLPELIGYMLRRAQLAVFQDFARSYAKFGIRPAQYAVLTVIERNPGLKQKDVSEALGIKRANFVAMCDELEKLGLASRRQVITDRRSYALHLTRKGETLMRKLHAVNAEHEGRIVQLIGEDGRNRLIPLLTALAGLAVTEDGGDL